MDSLLADRAMVQDVLNFSTMFIVSRLLAGKALDDNAWMMSCLYTLLGLIAYNLIVKKIVPNNMNGVMEKVMNSVLKWGTMLLVSRLLSGEPLNNEWMMSTTYTLLGFIAFDVIVEDLLPKKVTGNKNMDIAFKNAGMIGTMLVVSRLLSGDPMDQSWSNGAMFQLVGFATYDIVVGPMILN